jgi:hypothetical protein
MGGDHTNHRVNNRNKPFSPQNERNNSVMESAQQVAQESFAHGRSSYTHYMYGQGPVPQHQPGPLSNNHNGSQMAYLHKGLENKTGENNCFLNVTIQVRREPVLIALAYDCLVHVSGTVAFGPLSRRVEEIFGQCR